MGNIFYNMACKMMKALPCLGVFLAAMGAENFCNGMAAVLAFGIMAQFIV